MPAAANAVRRLLFIAPVVGLLALAAWVPSASATGGIAADPDAATTTPSQQGTDVKLPGPGAVQQALHVPVTHVWDHRTREAVRAFQRQNGLVVDGIVGPQTAAALGLSASATDASTTHVSAELQKIADCESGGDPTAISKDGVYRGKYQFTRSTWANMGGHGDPAKAAEKTQDRLAAKLLSVAGPSAWPTCG
jgi:Transglycosylase-like domain/Putative peptidoglycan binding domain